ncbi:MAG: 4-hydroxythreonine-4-phosphate dehydrogenase PdxA [Hyphomicrobiales bacterium]|nr:MAG: 4-hydroxythreonine-4-phosphate dehydrogenase PdxA [Hyphomicrobiales bacterium]
MRTSSTGDEAGGPARAGLPLAVTMGDPDGIGLDITLSAWFARRTLGLPPFALYADVDAVRARAQALRLDAPLSVIEAPEDAAGVFPRALPVIALDAHAKNGTGTIASIERATEHVARGRALALVTNPITKSKPGFERLPYPGHTEFLADLAQRFLGGPRPHPVMMLACDLLRVVPVTVHIPIARVPQALTADLLRRTLEITHRSLVTDFAIASPRIAVAGLNPHAGEQGLIGREDMDVIAPVIAEARSRGMEVAGPLSADTMFHTEARANYDAALAMYHDQALIPIKTLAFDSGVNVTLGLPFVRTSPDHGTAFALAGTGKARPDSFIAALRLAHTMGERRFRARARS